MLVTTIVITVIVALGLVGWRLSRGLRLIGSGARSWKRIALVDRTTGGVTTVDESGEVDAEIVGFGRTTEVHTFGARAALVGIDQIVIVDTDDPTPSRP